MSTGFRPTTKKELKDAVTNLQYGRGRIPVQAWDVSQITDFSGLFETLDFSGINKYNLFGMDEWNTEHVTNMERMLASTQDFPLYYIEKWNISNVTNMREMLADATGSNIEFFEFRGPFHPDVDKTDMFKNTVRDFKMEDSETQDFEPDDFEPEEVEQAQQEIARLNELLNCKDYFLEMKRQEDFIRTISFSSLFECLEGTNPWFVCLIHQTPDGNRRCVSNIVLTLKNTTNDVSICSYTHRDYENRKINRLLRAVVILVANKIPKLKTISSLPSNTISAYLLLKYFNGFTGYHDIDARVARPDVTFDEIKEAISRHFNPTITINIRDARSVAQAQEQFDTIAEGFHCQKTTKKKLDFLLSKTDRPLISKMTTRSATKTMIAPRRSLRLPSVTPSSIRPISSRKSLKHTRQPVTTTKVAGGRKRSSTKRGRTNKTVKTRRG